MAEPTKTPLEALNELSKAAQRLAHVAQGVRADAMGSALEDHDAAVLAQPLEPLREAAREVTEAFRAVEDKFG